MDVGSVGEWAQVAKDWEQGNDGCVPRFYMREKQNTGKTEIEGRPIFDMKEYVEIFIPGERNNRPDRPVNDEDKQRWPDAYAEFKLKNEETIGGTPLESWAYLNRAQVAECKGMGIASMEGLASLPDGEITRMGMGWRDIVKRAQQHLQPQSDTEKELRETAKQQQNTIEQMQTQIDSLKNAMALKDMAEEDAPAPKRRGRPPKVRDDA